MCVQHCCSNRRISIEPRPRETEARFPLAGGRVWAVRTDRQRLRALSCFNSSELFLGVLCISTGGANERNVTSFTKDVRAVGFFVARRASRSPTRLNAQRTGRLSLVQLNERAWRVRLQFSLCDRRIDVHTVGVACEKVRQAFQDWCPAGLEPAARPL